MNGTGKITRQRRLSFATLAALGLPLAAGCLPQPGPNADTSEAIYRVVYTPDPAGVTVSVEQVTATSTTRPSPPRPIYTTTSPPTAVPVPDGYEHPPSWYAEDVEAYAAWSGNGYDYAQLEAIAEEWDVTEQEAMLRAGRAILAGDRSDFDEIVSGVTPDEHDDLWNDIDGDAYDAWWDAGYDYAELDVLAAEWGLNQYDAKARAGWAILSGDTSSFLSLIEAARSAEQVTTTTGPIVSGSLLPLSDSPDLPPWTEEELDAFAAWAAYRSSHAQLEALAYAWDSSQEEAMGRAGRAILAGDTSEVDSIIADIVVPDELAGRWNHIDYHAYDAWSGTEYDYAELAVLADEWGLHLYDTKARAGWAILAGDTSSFDSLVMDLASSARDGETDFYDYVTTHFWAEGFSYDEALALADEWNVDYSVAKYTAADLIAAGRRDLVEQLLADA